MKQLNLTKKQFYTYYKGDLSIDEFYESQIDIEKTAALLILTYQLRRLNIEGFTTLRDWRYKNKSN